MITYHEQEFDDTVCCWCGKEMIPFDLIIDGSVEDNGYCSIGCMVKANQRKERIKNMWKSYDKKYR